MIFGPYQWNASPWGKGPHLPCHITSPTPLSVRNMCRQKYVKILIWRLHIININLNHINLKLQMCIKTIKKCTFHIPHNCWQMNYVEKICIGDIEHYMYCKNYLWSISMKCLPHGVHLPCHVTAPRIYAKHCNCK